MNMDNNDFNNSIEKENSSFNQLSQNEAQPVAPISQNGTSNAVSEPLTESGTAYTAVNKAVPFSRRVRTSPFDGVAMVINFFLTFWFIDNALFGARWKVFASYAGIFALATVFITVKQKRFNAQAALSGLLCLSLSFSFALRDNPSELFFWSILILMYLSSSYCLALTGANRHSRGSYFFLLDVLKTTFLLPLKHLFLPYACMHNTRRNRKESDSAQKNKPDKRYTAAIVGIFCAVPVLFIVIPLLVKSDAAFESIAGSVTDSIEKFFSKIFGDTTFADFVIDNIFAFVPTVFVAPYIFSVMFSFRHGVSNEDNKDTSKKYLKLRAGSPALFSGFLGVICLVYVIYILSQTVYIFGAFGGKLPEGVKLTVSEYARRGFFELAGVAAVNLVLIAVTVVFSRRDDCGKIKPIIKVFDLFLCAFNVLLSAVSISKIVLYMNEMGLTHKRIYVVVIDFLMIVAFICVAVRLFKSEFPYMRVIASAVCVAITALSLAGVDRIIAEYNTEKYLNGEIHAEQVSDLTDGEQLGSFESVIKIAKSKTSLSENAVQYISEKYIDVNESVYSSFFSMIYGVDGKVSLSKAENSLFGDAARAEKVANENIDIIKESFKSHSNVRDEYSLLNFVVVNYTDDMLNTLELEVKINGVTLGRSTAVGGTWGFAKFETVYFNYASSELQQSGVDELSFGDKAEIEAMVYVVKNDETSIPAKDSIKRTVTLGENDIAITLSGNENDGYHLS